MTHAIVSVHPEHVKTILSGEKTVEVRSRRMHLCVGTRLWIYATLPIGAIQAVATVRGVKHMTSADAWRIFDESMALTRTQFKAYVNGSPLISIVKLSNVSRLVHAIPLARIRRRVAGYRPPQFFHRVSSEKPIYKILRDAYPEFFRNTRA